MTGNKMLKIKFVVNYIVLELIFPGLGTGLKFGNQKWLFFVVLIFTFSLVMSGAIIMITRGILDLQDVYVR